MVTRRNLLVSGGAGLGLIVAWAAWPRSYRPNLTAAPGETIYGAWLKIGTDGQVIVAVPQAEHGQGVWTALAQIVADELGADWRTIGVEAAPLNPLYANPLAADTLFAGAFDRIPAALRRERAVRGALMLTGGSTSIRRFESAMREAGAAARVLLCKAAAKRWGIDWTACETAEGFVVADKRRIRFAELAAEAISFDLPADLPLRVDEDGRLTGKDVPRLDVPSKVDGSANFAADVRLPDMVFASIMQGPLGDSRLIGVNRAAAERVRGVVAVVQNERWVAALATDWWAADRAIAALAPRFATRGPVVNDASIAGVLDAALKTPGHRFATSGDIAPVMGGPGLIVADYLVTPAFHAALEPPCATAWFHGDRLEMWIGTQAPGLAREAAARAIGISPDAVILHPTLIGGSFGAALEVDVAAQAAILAAEARRPVQLVWSQREALARDRFRAPAKARMTARLASNGAIIAWRTQIAAPSTGRELAARLMPSDALVAAALALPAGADGYAVAGSLPPYRLPGCIVEHHPAKIGLPGGHLKGGAHGYTCFFTESFLDELARQAGMEPMSFRIGMLGGDARLARCLSTAAALGGWDGGGDGSGQGIACHTMAGSCIAVLAEAEMDQAGRPRVNRLVAAVDCGRQVNPDIIRQQIEGGLIFGLAAATSAGVHIDRNLVTAHRFGELALPRLADTPDITVELIASNAEPGGIGDLGMVAVAPAIANALYSATGKRLRALPLGHAA
ncbi:molybdopterin cofactor-binding domain-containing protein [Sphingomonas sp. TX0543]|uniref:xanthine dehydrogenase family protein molybdopterin-binding subunit n=1 Tax=unclassified Sphingomonas TaxID=196159 RepID=UPI0010F8B1DC|nr:molybdopterin cofactor-binding domain-containing protein [Sphingomonas sp. 3P27F8]